jgi:4'-phosphopantetheinyl transferase
LLAVSERRRLQSAADRNEATGSPPSASASPFGGRLEPRGGLLSASIDLTSPCADGLTLLCALAAEASATCEADSRYGHIAVTPCELWYVRTSDVEGPLATASEALLTAEERNKRRAFLFEKHRHEYLVTRVLAQWVLARWTGHSPGAVQIRRTELGRPVLHPASDIRFNLTNTVELVACLVARGRELGVDAEPLARADQILGLSATVFTEQERAALARLGARERRRRAVELWTYKEAYMKARGRGLSIPPERFQVVYQPHGPVLDLRQLGDDDGRRWELGTREIAGHLVATCIERTNETGCVVNVLGAHELLFWGA